MIEAIYISHTTGCTGWNMRSIYEELPIFRIACRTMDFHLAKKDTLKMLDWDFRRWKKTPKAVEKKHLELSKKHSFEVIMSMDLWDYNVFESIAYYYKLKENCKRVLIPVHYYCENLLGLDLAYPNANWFSKNLFPPPEYRKYITHLLGGSPQSQLYLLSTNQKDLHNNSLRFKNVKTIDGNQLFYASVRYGKFWINKRPYWKKPRKTMSNEEVFKRSLENLNKEIVRINNTFF